MALKILLVALIFIVIKQLAKGWLAYNQLQENIKKQQQKAQKNTKKTNKNDIFEAEYKVVNED